jgi:hypothetical protein
MGRKVKGFSFVVLGAGLLVLGLLAQGGQTRTPDRAPVSDDEAAQLVGGMIKCDLWAKTKVCGGIGGGCEVKNGLWLYQVNPNRSAWRGENCAEIKQLCNYVPCGNPVNCNFVWRNHPCDEKNPTCPDPNADCPLNNPF